MDLFQFVMFSVSLRRQFYGLSFREAALSGKVVRASKKVTSLLLFLIVIAFLLLFTQIYFSLKFIADD